MAEITLATLAYVQFAFMVVISLVVLAAYGWLLHLELSKTSNSGGTNVNVFDQELNTFNSPEFIDPVNPQSATTKSYVDNYVTTVTDNKHEAVQSIFYIDGTSGSDSNDGSTKTSAMLTIQHAFDTVAAVTRPSNNIVTETAYILMLGDTYTDSSGTWTVDLSNSMFTEVIVQNGNDNIHTEGPSTTLGSFRTYAGGLLDCTSTTELPDTFTHILHEGRYYPVGTDIENTRLYCPSTAIYGLTSTNFVNMSHNIILTNADDYLGIKINGKITFKHLSFLGNGDLEVAPVRLNGAPISHVTIDTCGFDKLFVLASNDLVITNTQSNFDLSSTGGVALMTQTVLTGKYSGLVESSKSFTTLHKCIICAGRISMFAGNMVVTSTLVVPYITSSCIQALFGGSIEGDNLTILTYTNRPLVRAHNGARIVFNRIMVNRADVTQSATGQLFEAKNGAFIAVTTMESSNFAASGFKLGVINNCGHVFVRLTSPVLQNALTVNSDIDGVSTSTPYSDGALFKSALTDACYFQIYSSPLTRLHVEHSKHGKLNRI